MLRGMLATPLGYALKIPLGVRILIEIDKLAAHGRRAERLGRVVDTETNEQTVDISSWSRRELLRCTGGHLNVSSTLCTVGNEEKQEDDRIVDRLTQLLQIGAIVNMVEEGSSARYSPSDTWLQTRESVLLVRDFVVEFSNSPIDTTLLGPGPPTRPALSNLVYALLEWEFLSEHAPSQFSWFVYPNPLLSALSRSAFYLLGPQSTAHSIVMAVLHTLLAFSTRHMGGREVILLPALFKLLYKTWLDERDERQHLMPCSPMPWSMLTLRDNLSLVSEPMSPPLHSRMAFVNLHRAEAVAAARSNIYSEFICFPPMRWLGARHDGHAVSPSLIAYVWRRYRPGMTRRDHLALWQSALSFGVLEAILDMHIPERLLLCQTDCSIAFSSHNMCILCVELLRDLKSAGKQTRGARARSIKDVLTRALLALDEAALPWKDSRGIFRDTGLTKDDAAEMICSLTTLSTGLYIAVHSICRKELIWADADSRERTHTLPKRSEVSAGSATYVLQRKMIAAGWCPFTVHGVTHDSLALALLAFACARKPFVRKAQVEHTSCTSARCIIRDIDSAGYTTQHTPDACSCPFVSPPLSAISDLLLKNEVPVLTYDGHNLSVRRAGDRPYVAISHVWADGLGSTTEHGLPMCQVMRISTAAHKLIPSGAFWIDSLCVPGKVDLRKRAIRLMAQTYRLAEKVLVFDTGIRSMCSMAQSMDENYLRIMTSTWVQRVWTLQEALLSRELYFEFSDGLVASWEIFLPPSHGLINLYSPIRNDFLMSPSLRFLHHDTTGTWSDARYTFHQIAGLLMRRTTSKPEDETVAVAGLLNVDVALLLDEHGQDARMRIFLLQVRTLPAAIALVDAPVRLSFPGFRWAPRSFSGIEEEIFRGSGMATCTADGLTTDQELTIISFPRTSVSKSTTSSPNSIYLHLSSNSLLYAMPDLRKLAGEGVHEIDAVIIFPSASETPLVAKQPVVAVSTDMIPGDLKSDSDGAKVLKCVYRFRAYLGNWSERVPPSRMRPEFLNYPPNEVLLEAQRFSRRVMIT
ncbi:hypothetical protein L226DRAFT_572873 [Lentinus tigrinus ALCF2SS1-7]|uniref:Heterokaryon incompatibility domain-containing protein n=1 Tax=Lentinus tigrinus ALCF2SS1-6 TaxID=1328759 RepID=A0A5C2S686_9APHY|nr:hypothetical protein L227DRAFT_612706 [Lentinus tigrinus ALCF2SS1-6]RPD72762.1 hypothetical protein L226DRAFT_572873 [Lentinus tigrinus ALCF2SS1-7]